MSQKQSPLLGVLWMLLTTVNFVALGIFVKLIGDGVPIMQATFLRFALGLVFLIPALKAVRSVSMTPQLWKLSIGRACFQAVAMVSWFYAMTQIPLSEVTAINFMNPIFVTIGAVLIFGERIALPRIMALIVAFVGAFIVLRPGFRELSLGHFSVMVTALCLASSYLFANAMVKKMPASVVVFYVSVLVPVLLFPFAVLQWQSITLGQIGLLFCTAFFATAGHFTMTKAFTLAPQTLVQPVVFVQLIWATVAGVLLFGEALDVYVILGGALIGGSVSFVSYREARQGKVNAKNAALKNKSVL